MSKLQAIPETQRRKRELIGWIIAAGASLIVVGAWAFVLVQGLTDWNPTALQLRGTFGDSFGVISAIFSGMAFIGASYAVWLQREQLIEQRDQMQRAAESERASGVENRFFQLLNSLQTAVNSTRVAEDLEGRQAIRYLAERLTKYYWSERRNTFAQADFSLEQRRSDINDWFLMFYNGTVDSDGNTELTPYGDLLGHYFRLIFQIVRYIHESEAIDRKEKGFYIRILRAHLSTPELVLIFYNSLSRNGYPSFFDLIEEYNLLKNIDPNNGNTLPNRFDALLYQSLKDKVQG